MRLENLVKGCVVVCSIAMVSATGAQARIRCDGEFQVNSGQRIATPYCEDAYLAQVARTYGSRVSADAIRNSVQIKERTCRFAGADIRVKSICEGYRNEENIR